MKITKNLPDVLIKLWLLSSLACMVQVHALAQDQLKWTNVSANDLSFFKTPHGKWKTAGRVSFGMGPATASKIAAGTETIVHAAAVKVADQLVSKNEFGDLALEFDFMLAQGTSIRVFLQGRYGIELTDSWGNTKPGSPVSGSLIEPEQSSASFVTPPRLNACRAPGLWQHVQVIFRAPKFDGQNKKTANASFARIALNGSVIYENLEIAGPSRNSTSTSESSVGPIVFTSDNVAALKNIRYSVPDEAGMATFMKPEAGVNLRERPIIVNPSSKTIVQRCFIAYEGKKKTFCVAVGTPTGMHYAMDLSQGSIINLWRGEFIDATSMWTDRGEYQVARPVGSKLEIRPVPAIAVLGDKNAAWPDSAGSDFRFKGYRLNASGEPTFMYQLGEMRIDDSYFPKTQGNALARSLKLVSGKLADSTWIRLAGGSSITALGDGLYAIGDNEYYIRLAGEKSTRPAIRTVANGQEIVVPGSALQRDFNYELIW